MTRPTHAQISRSALRNNVRVLRDLLQPGTGMMAVVKDNCYGHNVNICIPELINAGVDFFGVATVEEARQLRAMGVTGRIALLATPIHGTLPELAELDLDILVSNPHDARQISDCAAAVGRRLRIHAYLDTGMTRNGTTPEEMPELLAAIAAAPGLHLQGLASHTSGSDVPDSGITEQQIAIFEGVLRTAQDAGYTFGDIHIANSGGILNHLGSHYTLVRPGLALYGYHPTRDRQAASELQPVMMYRTEVSSLRQVPAGTPVSYGSTYVTQSDTIIATLSLGYGDGLPRLLSNKASFLINGKRHPQAGTIGMDETMLNIGLDTEVSVGDEVIIIGHSGDEHNDAWDLAELIGTIPYEITTRISPRVPLIPVP